MATQMQLSIILGEVSQKEKDKSHMTPLIVESKIGHKWTYLQNGNRLTGRDQICGRQGMGGGWSGNVGLVDVNHRI